MAILLTESAVVVRSSVARRSAMMLFDESRYKSRSYIFVEFVTLHTDSLVKCIRETLQRI